MTFFKFPRFICFPFRSIRHHRQVDGTVCSALLHFFFVSSLRTVLIFRVGIFFLILFVSLDSYRYGYFTRLNAKITQLSLIRTWLGYLFFFLFSEWTSNQRNAYFCYIHMSLITPYPFNIPRNKRINVGISIDSSPFYIVPLRTPRLCFNNIRSVYFPSFLRMFSSRDWFRKFSSKDVSDTNRLNVNIAIAVGTIKFWFFLYFVSSSSSFG